MMQGGVVQNAGMTWISNVGRILDREVLNFGFSGNCLMQPEVAKYLVELKVSVFVMDCLPNMDAAAVHNRTPAVLKQLRAGIMVYDSRPCFPFSFRSIPACMLRQRLHALKST